MDCEVNNEVCMLSLLWTPTCLLSPDFLVDCPPPRPVTPRLPLDLDTPTLTSVLPDLE